MPWVEGQERDTSGNAPKTADRDLGTDNVDPAAHLEGEEVHKHLAAGSVDHGSEGPQRI